MPLGILGQSVDEYLHTVVDEFVELRVQRVQKLVSQRADALSIRPGSKGPFFRPIHFSANVGNDPINQLDPNGRECVTVDTTTCGSSNGNAATTAAQAVTTIGAVEGIGAEQARGNYNSEVAKLSPDDSAGRSQAKQTARSHTPPITRAAIESSRPSTSAKEGSGGTANRTSAAANKTAKTLGKIGKGSAVLGIAIGGARIATADDKSRETVVVVGGVGGSGGGALAGGAVGFALAGPPGGVVGALVGGLGGGFAGEELAGAAYDNLLSQ